jgi:hypothetical protein
MKHIAMSVTNGSGTQWAFDARVSDECAAAVEAAARAGIRIAYEGVLVESYPDWAVGTPLQPIFAFISRLWLS